MGTNTFELIIDGEVKATTSIEIVDSFNVAIELVKDKETLVPLGIPSYEGTPENKNIEFEIEVKGNDIDDFEIELLHNDKVIQSYFSGTQVLDEVVITAKGSGNNTNTNQTDDDQDTARNYPIGKYSFKWDGFDSNGIYDSTLFTSGKLKARIKARRDGREKTAESSEFAFEYKKVQWVDTKIDRNAKRIDITLRVNLKDGGQRGTENDCYRVGSGSYAPERTICPWEKIPEEDLIQGKSPIKTLSQAKSFEDLEKLALKGLNYHWGRNRDHVIAKNVDIKGEKYEIFVNTVNTTNNAMDDINLIFNTNGDWLRSMNPGSVDGIASFFGQVMPERIVYNYGYMNGSKSWYWLGDNVSDVNDDFAYTSAHEIGHEILKKFSGKSFHSYKHKGSSTLSETLPTNEGGVDYPNSGEIDLMKYYNNDPYWYDFERIVASENDVLGLIWLGKLEVL